MTSYLNIIRYVKQDIKFRIKLISGFLFIFPSVMLISVLPIIPKTIVTWSSWKDFIFSFRFEFFYVPIFVVIIGSLFLSNDWIILRRYEKREHITINKIGIVIAVSTLISFVYCCFGLVVSFLVERIVYKYSLWSIPSILQYQPQPTVQSSFVLFLTIFFLITCIIGTIYIILVELFNRIIAAFITITLVILEKFTFNLITFCFTYGHEDVPGYTILTLVGIILLLVVLLKRISINKDFLIIGDDK